MPCCPVRRSAQLPLANWCWALVAPASSGLARARWVVARCEECRRFRAALVWVARLGDGHEVTVDAQLERGGGGGAIFGLEATFDGGVRELFGARVGGAGAVLWGLDDRSGSSGGWRRRPWPFPRSATLRWPRRGAPTWCPCSCVSVALMASGACGFLGTIWPWCAIVQPKGGSAGPVPRPSLSRCWPDWRLGAGGSRGRPSGVAPTWPLMGRQLPGSFGRLVCGGVAFWAAFADPLG